jgi:hypothetical protein
LRKFKKQKRSSRAKGMTTRSNRKEKFKSGFQSLLKINGVNRKSL